MNIDRARKIDYWAGVPLCALCSLIYYFGRIFRRSPKKQAVRKVLFIKLSELGSIVLAHPLLKSVQRQFPSASLYFLTFAANKDIFEHFENVVPGENVLTIREGPPGAFFSDTLKAIGRMRREKIDMVIDLEFFSRFSSLLSFASGARSRAGFFGYTFEGLYRGSFLTHRVQFNPLLHMSKSYLSFVQVVARDAKYSPELEFPVDGSQEAFPRYASCARVRVVLAAKLAAAGLVELQGKKLYLINPGEGMLPLREWPLENFIALAGRILAQDDAHRVVLVGAAGAATKAKALKAALGSSACVDFVQQTSLQELLELYTMSHALLCNDCGLAHLAMMTRLPKYVLFGPESPQIFGLQEPQHIFYAHAPCSPCVSVFNHRNSACKDNWCLKRITVDEIAGVLLATK